MPVAPHDDHTIRDEEGLVRLVPNEQIVYDGNLGAFRPSSGAFSMSSKDGCMSVDLEAELVSDGLPSTHSLGSRPAGTGAVRILAEFVRSLQLAVFRDPLEENPYHGQIANLNEHGKITKGARNKLWRSSEWISNPKE